ncbi:hypothetical protein ACO3VM_04890 [Methanocaldococcus sp. 10A]
MDPIYIFTGEVLKIDIDRKRLVFDCGIKLECDTEGKFIESEVNRLKEGD